MASFLELKFSTPSGTKTATVFTDTSGHVTSEHGLVDLLEELRRRKKVKTPLTIDHEIVDKFFDLSSPTSPDLEELRKSYLREQAEADTRGCTKCTRAAIYRKYVAIINKNNS